MQLLQKLIERARKTPGKKIVIPNGFDPSTIRYSSPTNRAILRARVGLPSVPVAVFVGSWHGPNLEAVEAIIEGARNASKAKFLIVGSAGEYFRGRELPPNVFALGVVSSEVLSTLLASCDFALNPIVTGSGSNLKLIDYFAAGIPTYSTRFGTRGTSAKAGKHYIEIGTDSIADCVKDFIGTSRDMRSIAANAALLAYRDYSWPRIGAGARAALGLPALEEPRFLKH
jgi:glycosyltransferase involved in cell wall biosynthesis